MRCLVAAAFVSTLILPIVGRAQEPPSAQGSGHSAISLGAGVTGVGFAGTPTLGVVVQAGYLRQYDRIGVRLGVDYYKNDSSVSSGDSFRPRAIGATLE